ncbi:L-ascorbate peroxidase 3-like [Prosopis cineraria]|uniref:L-ascorbate peroxidase 3-like n=1 Tax=Prosopis cineraria TaxID=364024 RepID=UPI00240F931F|nr:L-ascorbate peroxidase 3-like [Prosopis cineraria]
MAPPSVGDDYKKQIEGARKELNNLIKGDKNRLAPLMLRLALHDAGIYGFITGVDYLIKRGPNGSIRNNKVERDHPSNKGLIDAMIICERVKENNDKITYADLYQLAGVAAVKLTGGPEIEFVPGRKDSTEFPEQGLLPNNKLDKAQLEKITQRMGLEKKDIVALFGGLHQWDPPSPEPAKTEGQAAGDLKFGNSYFKGLQDRDKDNPLLKFGEHASTYEKNEEAFKNDYKEAHRKVSERGMPAKEVAKKEQEAESSRRHRVRLVQGIGIAVVTTAIILGFFLSRRNK